MMLFDIKFWQPQPTLPALGSNIPSARRRGQRFHFLQCRGSSPRLHFVNRHGGTLRMSGWVAFTKHILEESDWYCIYLRLLWQSFTSRVPCIPVFDIPASPSHTSPRPIVDVLKSLVSRPQVASPHTRVPMSLSPCPRPTFIHSPTAQKLFQSLYLSTLLIHTYYFVTSFLMRKNCHDKWNVYFKLADWHEIRKPFA